MIIKVQIPLYPPGSRECVVYNRDRTVSFQGEIPEEVRKQMKGEVKAYFHAELVKGYLEIGEKLPRHPNW